MSAENSRSMTWSSSSLVPSKPTMEWPSGTTIRIVEPGLSLRVSVNSLLSARRPGHRAAAEQARVHVGPALPPPPRGRQSRATAPPRPRRKRRHVLEVAPRHHQDVRGRLRVEVTEGNDPL